MCGCKIGKMRVYAKSHDNRSALLAAIAAVCVLGAPGIAASATLAEAEMKFVGATKLDRPAPKRDPLIVLAREENKWEGKRDKDPEDKKGKDSEDKKMKESKECNDWRYQRVGSQSKHCKHNPGFENIWGSHGLNGHGDNSRR